MAVAGLGIGAQPEDRPKIEELARQSERLEEWLRENGV